MNERQPYEKHLADKLQQLPPPADVDTSWVQMKKLLDEDMPRGGGFWKNRWWLGSLFVLLLITGAWFIGTRLAGDNKLPVESSVAATPNPANAPTTPAVNEPADNGQQQTKHPDETVASSEPAKENKPDIIDVPEHKPAGTDATTKLAAKESPPVRGPSHTSSSNLYARKNKSNTDLASIGDNRKSEKINRVKSSIKEKVLEQNTTLNKPSVNKPSKKTEELLLRPSGNYSPVDYMDQLVGPSVAIQEKYAPFTERDLFPNLVNKRVTAAAKSKWSSAGRTSEAKTFAIGLSLPLGFPLGDQKALGYNSNAGVNTVSDYLPSPNLQYHFNSKTYIQTELQFITPQFIRPILLYQQVQTPTANSYIYNSVYAKKLYYFNVPVAIHHSPFKNFYLGTGLQFSTMLSGVALYESVQRSYGMQDVLLNEQYKKFSSDSLSSRFNSTEMRLLLDMNYYFNRFTVGLRYNQALNNYVSFQVNPSSPYTYDKNKALLFYLRYNLWEDLKRKKPAKSLFTLK